MDAHVHVHLEMPISKKFSLEGLYLGDRLADDIVTVLASQVAPRVCGVCTHCSPIFGRGFPE